MFFYKSYEFLTLVRDGQNQSVTSVLDTTSFTRATLQYAPGCLEILNATLFSPQSQDGAFDRLFANNYNDLTCLMGYKCQDNFTINPYFNTNNPNGSFFVAIQNPDFWAYIDNKTKGDCSFQTLSQGKSIEELISLYQVATVACFCFLIFAFTLSLVTTIHNIVNFHRKRLAQFYDFVKYIVEDMSQLCIQIFIFSYQVGIRCWLCTTENGCGSTCDDRPTSPQLPSTSDFTNLDVTINDTLILLCLTMTSMALNALNITVSALYNVRRHPKYFVPGLFLSPFFLLGLLTPLSWACSYALIPILEIENQAAKTVTLSTAIAGTIVFPFVFIGMFYHFFHHSKHDNRVRKHTLAALNQGSATPRSPIEMTPPLTGPPADPPADPNADIY